MSNTKPNYDADAVEIIDVKTGYKGFFRLSVLTLKHKLFNGGWSKPIQRELLERGNAAGVLLYDPARDEVGLVEQFRVGAMARNQGPWMVEVIAGMMNNDDDAADVAAREAKEEAGVDIDAKSLMPITTYYVSPGGVDERFSLFCGMCDLSNVSGIHGLEHEGEDIRVVKMSFDEAMKGLASGHLDNASTIICLQWLQINRALLRHESQVHS